MDTLNIVVVVVFGGLGCFLVAVFLAGKCEELTTPCRFRLFSVYPYALLGGFGLHIFHNTRITGQVPDDSRQWMAMLAHTGISGCIGIIATVWTYVSAKLSNSAIEARSDKPIYRYRSRQISRHSIRIFYVTLIDLIFIVCLVDAAAVGHGYLPPTIATCNSTEYQNLSIFGTMGVAIGESPEESCRRSMAVQILVIMVLVIMGVQYLYLVRFASLPTPVRASLFILVRGSRRTVTPLEEVAIEGTPMFGQERSEVESEGSNSGPAHPCPGTHKEACWVCSAVICEACRVSKNGVRGLRTTSHLRCCYAICTRCYITQTKVEPTSLVSTWNSHKLALHHFRCSNSDSNPQEVQLCTTCAALDVEEIALRREGREQAALAVMCKRKLRCFECDIVFQTEKHKWWICDSCKEECHWAGHSC